MKIAAFVAPLAALVASGVLAAEPSPLWEVTLGATGKRSDAGWKIASPEAEVKYQWSDRLELGVKVNWTTLRPNPGQRSAAMGAGEFAYKYRFIDAADAGVDVAFAPELATRLTRSSVRRDVAPEDKEFLLGLETTYVRDKLEVEVKSGWNFIEHQAGHLVLEVKTTYHCAARLYCVFTGERKVGPGEKQTGAKAEIDIALTPAQVLKIGLGREFGPYSLGQRNRIVQVALQSTF